MKLAMLDRFRGAVIVCVAILLVASPAAASDPASDPAVGDRDPWYVTAGKVGAGSFDVLLLRPFCFATTAVGFGAFTAVLPFSAIAQEIRPSWELFVEVPGAYTFTRPIGDF